MLRCCPWPGKGISCRTLRIWRLHVQESPPALERHTVCHPLITRSNTVGVMVYKVASHLSRGFSDQLNPFTIFITSLQHPSKTIFIQITSDHRVITPPTTSYFYTHWQRRSLKWQHQRKPPSRTLNMSSCLQEGKAVTTLFRWTTWVSTQRLLVSKLIFETRNHWQSPDLISPKDFATTSKQ